MSPDLPPQRVDLVAAGESQGRPADQEEGHVGSQPPGQPVQPGRAQADAPEPVQGHEDGRGVAAAPTETAPDRDPLGDGDFGSPLDARMALQLEGGPQREVSRVLRHVGVVAAHLQAAPPWPDDDVVVEVDRLEERAQLVVAVLAHAQDLQPEVHLGVGRHAKRARPGGRLQRPLHRLRASSGSTER